MRRSGNAPCWKGSRVADGRWRISVTPPDWGQDHLSLEAVVAYVDGELAPGPHARASQHLGQCPECAAQVSAQGQARKALRTAGGPCLPSALLSSLRAIPQDTDLPGPPPGLAMTADGQLVSMLRPEPGSAPMSAPADTTPSTRHRPPSDAAPPLRGPARLGRRRGIAGCASVPGSPSPGSRSGALVFGAPDASAGRSAGPGSRQPIAACRAGVRRPERPADRAGRAAAAGLDRPRPAAARRARPLIAAATRTSPPLRHAGGRSDPRGPGSRQAR